MRTSNIGKKRIVKESRGITLIALVITIIVLLILAAVSIATLTGENGILTQAGNAKDKTTEATAIEKVQVEVLGSYDDTGKISIELLNDNLENVEGLTSGLPIAILPATVTVDGYDIIIDANGNVSLKGEFNAEEWDKTATPEDCFIWGSDTEGEEGYDVIIGYTEKLESYTKLKIPSRCTKIDLNTSYTNTAMESSRSFGNSIKAIELPDTITEIGDYSFAGNPWSVCFNNLESITISNSVRSIGNYAFWFCESLENVIIPESVTTIGYGAFSGCTSLNNVTISNGVTNIGYGAFSGCTSLGSIEIPSSITSIEYGVFSYCTSLDSIVIPDSVTNIGGNAFNDTAWYDNQPDGIVYAGKVAYKYKGEMPSNTNIKIQEGTKAIASDAFTNCVGLVSIKIPNSVTSIGSSAFMGCSSLTSIEIPEGITSIGSSAFSGCSSLTSIEIPNSVTSIGGSAFEYCRSLTSIEIPDSITRIESYTFRECTNLKNISISKNVSYIGSEAFSDCTNLLNIVIWQSVDEIERRTFVGWGNTQTINIEANEVPAGWDANWNEECNANIVYAYTGE